MQQRSSNALAALGQRIHRIKRLRAIIPALCASTVAAVLCSVSAEASVAVSAMISLFVFFVMLVLGLQREGLDRPGHRWASDFLDNRYATLENSSGLLDSQPGQLNPLERYHHRKILTEFEQLQESGVIRQDLRQAALNGMSRAVPLCILLLACLVWLGPLQFGPSESSDVLTAEITSVSVQVTPPVYTGAASERYQRLDMRVHEASTVIWSIRLDEPAQSVAFRLHDGELIPLALVAGRWISEEWAARATVYQLEVDNTVLPGSIARIDTISDNSPQVSMIQPDATLILIDELARTPSGAPLLSLSVEASDDYGLVDVQARVTLASGSGEQVQFREQAVALSLQRDGPLNAFAKLSLDLADLGMVAGDELYLFAEAVDNRPLEPNTGTTGTIIVRWPDPEAEAMSGVEGMAIRVMPEYFRSQRQLIIDTQKLIRERDQLTETEFFDLAQALAADQKLLRLRYGVFLGEEFDSGIGTAPANAAAQSRLVSDDHDDHDSHDEHDEESDHEASASVDDHGGSHDDHDHEPEGFGEESVTEFGDAEAAIALNAHFHDSEEEATLFEPTTRQWLKMALDAMWDAELELRMTRPEPALPHEFRALEALKKVQQTARIYLKRVGFRPTPVDEARRLTGELDDIDNRELSLNSDQQGIEARLSSLLAQLLDSSSHQATGSADAKHLAQALMPEIRQLAAEDSDWLPVLDRLERFVQDGNCQDCRQQLASELWARSAVPHRQPSMPASGKRGLNEHYSNRIRHGAAEDAP